MNCKEFIDVIRAYLDGEMASESREVFEHHIGLCPDCGTYLDTYRETVRLGQAAYEGCIGDEVPEDVPEALIRAVLAAKGRDG